MKVEELLNPDPNVGLGRHLPQHQLVFQPGAILLGQIDLEHDAVYFSADSSPKSFSGHLSEGLEDEEVIEYIRRNNLGLHERLWGIQGKQPAEPAASAIIAHQGFGDGAAGDSLGKDVINTRDNTMTASAKVSKKQCARRSISPALPKTPSSVSASESCNGYVLTTPFSEGPALRPAASASGIKDGLQQDLYLLQQRRYIQSLLLNDHILIIQKVPPGEAKVRSRSCDHPFCRFRHGIPPRAYRLSLELKGTLEKASATTDKYYSSKDEDTGNYLKVRSTNSRGFYCLTCIEDLFSGVGMLDDDYATSTNTQQASLMSDSRASVPISMDGSTDGDPPARMAILQAAEKLWPTTRHVNEARVRSQAKITSQNANEDVFHGPCDDLVTDPANHLNPALLTATSQDCDFGDHVATQYPSNSDEAVLLRDKKRQETEVTLHLLQQVAQKQQTRRLSWSSGNSELPSLKLLRPIDISRQEERYKKQGLTRQDLRLWWYSLSATSLEQDAASTTISINEASAHHPTAPTERFCYCQEPDDSERMIQCSAEFCLVGWVHVRCSGLPRMPIKDETWFCKECATLFGPGTFDHALVITTIDDGEPIRVLRSNTSPASGSVDTNESGNIASDEFSTDEVSLSLSGNGTADFIYSPPMTPHRQSKSAVGMNFTPYQFLDGAGEAMIDVGSPITTQETIISNNGALTTPTSIKSGAKGAKRSLTRTKGDLTMNLQDPDELQTPNKRFRRKKTPPQLFTPPSRHIKPNFGHLAPFIYAETRISAAALSNPQIVALEKWKSIHIYSPLMEIIESSKSESVNSPSPSNKSQKAPATSIIAPNVATLELGGRVIDLPLIHGKKLSQILSEVDVVVEDELRKHGFTSWEQGVHAREEAVKIGKAKGSQVDEQNGLTSPKAANDVRRRILRSFSGSKNVE